MRASARREVWGWAVALLATTLLAALLWDFMPMRWIGGALVLVVAVLFAYHAVIAERIRLVDSLMKSGRTWAHETRLTIRQSANSQPIDVLGICDDVCGRMLKPRLGTYNLQSDHDRREDTVGLYSDSVNLLDDVAAALMKRTGLPQASFLIEKR